MRNEIDHLEEDAALRWAVGCVVASYAERINPMRASSLSPLLGVAALSVFVFGGYLLAGGRFDVLLEALPTIFITVVFGAFAASTILTTAGGRGIFGSVSLSLQGRRFRADDYRGLTAVLADVLTDKASALTGRTYPILYHGDVMRMIVDAKSLANDRIGAETLAAILRTRIDSTLADQQRAVRALKTLGQSLLWFGFIALLLGAVKTLISVTELPEVIGGMFAHTLVAPLVGVFLAGAIVHPLARRLEAVIADDAHVYEIIRMAFYCRAAGTSVETALRTAIGLLPADFGVAQDKLDVTTVQTA